VRPLVGALTVAIQPRRGVEQHALEGGAGRVFARPVAAASHGAQRAGELDHERQRTEVNALTPC